jgi:hypothetical protein
VLAAVVYFVNLPTLIYTVLMNTLAVFISQSTMALKSRFIVALVLAIAFSVFVNANPINVHHVRDPGYKPAPGGRPDYRGMQKAKAVYFMTNLASNSIVALPVADDGSVSAGTTTSTGGAGGNLVDAMKGTPNGPDALGSQGSVQVVGNVCHTNRTPKNWSEEYTNILSPCRCFSQSI